MRKRRFYLVALSALALVSGCGDGERGAENSSQGPIDVFSASASLVLARVGETDVTVGDFRDRFEYELAARRFVLENVTKVNAKKIGKRLNSYADQRGGEILPYLVRTALVENFLKAKSAELTGSAAEGVVARNLALFGAKVKNRKITVDELASLLGVTPANFRRQVLRDAAERQALAIFAPGFDAVTEEEIDEGLARQDRYAVVAAASNRVTWATCSNVLARIQGGLDFVQAAKQWGLEEEEAKEWGFFSRDDIKEAPLRQWAFSAKVGEIGGPFDLEDGIAIVKVLEHVQGAPSASMAADKVEEVTLARVNFPAVDEHPEPHTREFCKKAIAMRKTRQTKKAMLEKLYDEAKIVYPTGRGIDYKRRTQVK